MADPTRLDGPGRCRSSGWFGCLGEVVRVRKVPFNKAEEDRDEEYCNKDTLGESTGQDKTRQDKTGQPMRSYRLGLIVLTHTLVALPASLALSRGHNPVTVLRLQIHTVRYRPDLPRLGFSVSLSRE